MKDESRNLSPSPSLSILGERGKKKEEEGLLLLLYSKELGTLLQLDIEESLSCIGKSVVTSTANK